MKHIYKINFLALIVLFVVGCQNDDLPKANFTLDAITGLEGVVGHEMVTLNWENPSRTPDKFIISWLSGSERIELDASVNSYTIKGLNNMTSYKFSIQADYGKEGVSGIAETELTPEDELDFNVLPGNELAIVKWNKPNRTDISGYTLSWSPNGDVVELTSDYKSYKVQGLQNDIEYDFELSINYEDGNISNDVQASVIPGEIEAFLMNTKSPMATETIQFSYNPTFLPESKAGTWNWDFGDGSKSSKEDPEHTYIEPGIYEVSLLVTDINGDSFSSSREVYIWGEKWSYTTGADIRSSSPAIGEDGTIYIGSRDNNLYAFNPDGTVKWTFATENGIDASPSIAADGTIYCGSYDDKMYAINPDGTLKWSFLTGSNIRYSTPAIDNEGTIYFGSEDTKLYALNPDGTVKWEFISDDIIRSTPAVSNDGVVYTTSNDNQLYAVNSKTGEMKWSYDLGGFSEGGPTIDNDGTVFVGIDKGGSDGAILAINSDGTEKWKSNIVGRISINIPIVANGSIYIGTKEGNNLLALDKFDGSQLWSFEIPGQIILSNPAVDKNGNIYVGAWDNGFYAINSDGSLKYHFESGRVWSSPAIGPDGTVYFGSYDDKIYALEMFAEGLAEDAWPMFGKNTKHNSH